VHLLQNEVKHYFYYYYYYYYYYRGWCKTTGTLATVSQKN